MRGRHVCPASLSKRHVLADNFAKVDHGDGCIPAMHRAV